MILRIGLAWRQQLAACMVALGLVGCVAQPSLTTQTAQNNNTTLSQGNSSLGGRDTASPQKSEPIPLTSHVAKPKIGLALGGGAARGFAHIGLIS